MTYLLGATQPVLEVIREPVSTVLQETVSDFKCIMHD